MAETKPLRLKVAGAQQQDIGKGIVRLGEAQVDQLGLGQGDIVEIKGKGTTAAIAVSAYPQDEGLDIIRMDGLIRGNAKVGIGEYVEVQKAEWKPAKKIVLAHLGAMESSSSMKITAGAFFSARRCHRRNQSRRCH